MRTILLLSFIALLGCGGDAAPRRVPLAPIAPPAPADLAPPTVADEPATPTAALVESCEAVVRPCGGWVGCVNVRVRPASGDLPSRYEAIGIEAGAVYVLRERCEDGCDEMCDPVSGTCRPGLVDEDDVDSPCTRSSPPSRAPFFCEMVEGACVRHDLPPAPPPGTRS
jgi:hypothetical protein